MINVLMTKTSSAGAVGDAVAGDTVGGTSTLVSTCDIGLPTASTSFVGDTVAAVGEGALVDPVGGTSTLVSTCDIGLPMASTSFVGDSVAAVGEGVLGDPVDVPSVLGEDEAGACDVGERVVGNIVGSANNIILEISR
jgi:hypothetical protein